MEAVYEIVILIILGTFASLVGVPHYLLLGRSVSDDGHSAVHKKEFVPLVLLVGTIVIAVCWLFPENDRRDAISYAIASSVVGCIWWYILGRAADESAIQGMRERVWLQYVVILVAFVAPLTVLSELIRIHLIWQIDRDAAMSNEIVGLCGWVLAYTVCLLITANSPLNFAGFAGRRPMRGAGRRSL